MQHVNKTFNPGGINEKVALQDVSIHFQSGDVVNIIGSNGAGKTTLLNVVAGAYPADRGTITLENREIQSFPEHIRAAEMGRVFQDPLMGTAATMTIEENLALAMRRGTPRRIRIGITASDRRLFRERLGLLGLGLEDRLKDRV
ncbi:MAG TPA: ATP-binding cassette domain-containing protein, partial [Clostridia bacterium]|nr:ATP-binding cassette domain-containing protein [Clostridia bacterium]